MAVLEDELLERAKNMPPRGFERMVLDLCEKMNAGVSSVHTGGPGDGGVDGIIQAGEFGLDKIYIQVKRHKEAVTNDQVMAFVGVLSAKSTKKGMFVTTGKIPKSARAVAEGNENVSVRLIDGRDLARLMIKYGAGVVDGQTLTIKKISADYFESFGG